MRARLLFILCILFSLLYSVGSSAQTQAYQVALRVTNQVAVSSTVYEFDVYLQNTGTNAARFANLQFGIVTGKQIGRAHV